MFERFTDRARRSLALALKQAQTANQAVSAEHILLGLLAEGDGQVEGGIASMALTAEGFSLRGMQETVRKIYETGGDKPWSVHEPYASSGKRVLNQGLREAIQLGHNWIGTEHLLLAVLDDDSVVERLSLPAERIRDRVLEILGMKGEPEEDEGYNEFVAESSETVEDDVEERRQWLKEWWRRPKSPSSPIRFTAVLYIAGAVFGFAFGSVVSGSIFIALALLSLILAELIDIRTAVQDKS